MTKATKVLTHKDLRDAYEGLTTALRCQATLVTPIVGGQPATRSGIEMFVEHHLNLTGTAAEQAVSRILHEEVGERETTPPLGEVEEKETYGVNVLRHDENGPWLGDWMVRACLKQAASRVKIFTSVRGQKGGMSEAGSALAIGPSLRSPGHPERIHLVDSSGAPAQTFFEEFSGRVNTPQGAKSIKHHSECAPVGTKFSFEFRFIRERGMNDARIAEMLGMAENVGLGSAKALSRGRFVFDQVEIIDAPKQDKEE